MNRIREVLRYEYIGAVAIGFLLAQVIGILISLIMRPISFYLERSSSGRSVFGRIDPPGFPWESLIGPGINLVLLGLVSFLLLRWLYRPAAIQVEDTETADKAVDDEESGGGA